MLSGIIESDETYFLETDKGKRNLTHRRSRKRGGVAHKRGISNELSVIVAHDRNGNILSKMAGGGWITVDEIDQTLSPNLDSSFKLT